MRGVLFCSTRCFVVVYSWCVRLSWTGCGVLRSPRVSNNIRLAAGFKRNTSVKHIVKSYFSRYRRIGRVVGAARGSTRQISLELLRISLSWRPLRDAVSNKSHRNECSEVPRTQKTRNRLLTCTETRLQHPHTLNSHSS